MNTILTGIGLVLGVSLFYSFLSVVFMEKESRKNFTAFFFGLSSLGCTVGLIGGFSRDSAAGEIMAAVLGLFGGFAIWLFDKDRPKGAFISFCILVFSSALLFSYIYAAERRNLPESYVFWRDRCLSAYSSAEIIGNEEAYLVFDAFLGRICQTIFNTEEIIVIENATVSQ